MKTFALAIVAVLVVALGGCCAPPPSPEHVVVPGPGGRCRVMHMEKAWVAKTHGCDSHSHLNWDQVPDPDGKP